MNHKDLKVWQNGIELVTLVYSFTENLPKSEDFGLKSQLRRAAVSVPTNIAEGAARNHQKEFIQFCHISLGSLVEIETLLIITEKVLKLQSKEINDGLIAEKKLLLAFIKHLKQTKPRTPTINP
jgi:four helix bundle protein